MGKWYWVVAALLLQGFYLWLFTVSFEVSLRIVGIRVGIRDLAPALFTSLIIDAVAPASTAGGIALLVNEVSTRGNSGAKAIAGTILQLIADFSTLTLILLFGLVYLFFQGQVQGYYVGGAAILLLITVCLAGILLLGLWKPTSLQRIFQWIEKFLNRLAALFRKPNLLAEDWWQKSSQDYIEASHAVAARPWMFLGVVLIMLGVHGLAIISMQALFAAFYQPIGLVTVLIGYTIGILIAITSPAPHSTGVVEGSMALAFVTLKLPWEVSVAVSLAYRGLSFWLPLLVGVFLLRRVKTFGFSETNQAPAISITLLTIVFTLMGALNLLPWAPVAWFGKLATLHAISPLDVHRTAGAFFWGVLILIIAIGLARRKRVFGFLALALMLLAALVHTQITRDSTKAIASIILAGWLFLTLPWMMVKSDGRLIHRRLSLLMGLSPLILLCALGGSYLFPGECVSGVAGNAIWHRPVAMLAWIAQPGSLESDGWCAVYAGSITLFCAIALGSILLAFLKPVQPQCAAEPGERAQATRIVEAYGRSSMAFFTLLKDKLYYFSQGGSVIAYGVQGRVAVVLGDPIGPEQDILNAICEFKAFCMRNDWLPAFCLTMPLYLEQYKQAGFHHLCLGHEAVVDLNDFHLRGRASSSYRKRYNRMHKHGYRVVFHEPPHSDCLLAQLRKISDEWLSRVSGSEKRFFLGWFDDDYVRNRRVAVIQAPDGHISAFATLVPEYQLNEVSVDLVRHERNVASGTMDFLFVSLFYWAKEQGYDTFNLGLNALAGVGENTNDQIIERIMHVIYVHGNWLYGFKGLYEFKRKFHPRWEPQYVIYPGLVHLPAVCLAMAQINANGRFVESYLKRKQPIYD